MTLCQNVFFSCVVYIALLFSYTGEILALMESEDSGVCLVVINNTVIAIRFSEFPK